MAVLAKTLVRGCHVRSFQIHLVPEAGWMASQETDWQTTKRRWYTDWHRVERAAIRFTLEVAELQHKGWSEA